MAIPTTREERDRTLNALQAGLPQPLLPLDYTPIRLREYGLADAHSYPAVADRLPDDSLHVTRVPAAFAWDHALVEWARTGNSYAAIALDIDSQEALERIGAANLGASSVPMPNVVSYRLATGHCHGVWMLETPVHRGRNARPWPLSVFARVTEWLRAEIGADAGYTGILVANPEHSDYSAVWLRTAGYSLTELKRPIPRGWRRPRRPTTDVGRNDAIFRSLRSWIGRPANWNAALEEVLARAHALNAAFAVELGSGEVRVIARSVHRIHTRKLDSGEQQATFSLIQSRRGARNAAARQQEKGRRSGESRRRETQDRDQRILQLLANGIGPCQVARAFDLHHTTVMNIRDRQQIGGRTTKAG